MFILREQDKHFLWSLYAAISLIFIWRGLWSGIYKIPYIGDPWVALFIGFAILTFSGIIFKEFDPLGGVEKAVNQEMQNIQKHPNKKHFTIKYHDKEQKKHINIDASLLKGVEKKALIVKHSTKQQEMFIPFHRITEIEYKGKTYWKL
ncbi:MAG: RNA repair domain-containing protein [Nanoarchaeota archaeon]